MLLAWPFHSFAQRSSMNSLFDAIAAILHPPAPRSRESREYCLRMAQMSEGSPIPVGIIRVLGTTLIPRIMNPQSDSEARALAEMSHTFFEIDRRVSYGRYLPTYIVDNAARALSNYFTTINDDRQNDDMYELLCAFISECQSTEILHEPPFKIQSLA